MKFLHLLLFSLISLLIFACNSTNHLNQEADPEPGSSIYIGQTIDFSEKLEVIAFGSCNRQDGPQRIWPGIVKQEPDLWIWLGDNIYGDTEDMVVMEKKYHQIKFAPEYHQLRETTAVIGTWDDHDFGVNDGGKEFSKKKESQDLALDFLDVPLNSRFRETEGIYQSYEFGEGNQQVKVILLDARYFRDELTADPRPEFRYAPNPEGDILGEEQWQWLNSELENSTAQIHIIGSGIQFIPEEHGWEKWANFPKSQQRLFNLIIKHQLKRPILLSGDRHIAEVSKRSIDGLSNPIYEVTSSGLSHTWGDPNATEPNQYRVSDFIVALNFGLLRIDWTSTEPTIMAEIRGIDGQMIESVSLNFK